MTTDDRHLTAVPEFIPPMTVAEVAAACGVTPAAVRNWRHQGKGPRSYRVGRRVLFDRADVAAFIDQCRAATGVGGLHPAA